MKESKKRNSHNGTKKGKTKSFSLIFGFVSFLGWCHSIFFSSWLVCGCCFWRSCFRSDVLIGQHGDMGTGIFCSLHPFSHIPRNSVGFRVLFGRDLSAVVCSHRRRCCCRPRCRFAMRWLCFISCSRSIGALEHWFLLSCCTFYPYPLSPLVFSLVIVFFCNSGGGALPSWSNVGVVFSHFRLVFPLLSIPYYDCRGGTTGWLCTEVRLCGLKFGKLRTGKLEAMKTVK